MSYYPPPQAGASYPYNTYPNYPQTPGSYPTTPYQTAYPPTAVTGYGATWPYPYSYYPAPQQAQQSVPNPIKPVVPATAGSATPVATTPAAPAPPRPTQAPATYTFQPSYTPAAAGGSSAVRGARRQPTFKGLFAKERTSYVKISP